MRGFFFFFFGVVQTADFFRADNPEGMEARNEVIFPPEDSCFQVLHITMDLFFWECIYQVHYCLITRKR